VVVVGAGYAGLTTARRLVAGGVEVAVLEARDRVGGRVWTVTTPGGAVVDHGGQWIGPTQDRLQALADEFAVGTFPTHVAGTNVEIRHGERHEFTGLVPMSDREASADVVTALFEFDQLAKEVSPAEPWTHPEATTLDRRTLGSWVEEHVDSPTGRDIVTAAVLAVFGAEPSELSLLFALAYARGGGGLNMLVRTTGGAQERRFTGGAQQMAGHLAAGLGDRLITGAPVTSVVHGPSGVSVVAEHPGTGAPGGDPGGTGRVRIDARRVVVAVPPAVQGRIAFDPPLPGDRSQLAQHAPMGSVTKVHAVFDRPFWREDGLSGQVVADAGTLRFVSDNSPEDGAHGVLMGFIAGHDDRRLESAGPAGRREAALADLVRAFGPSAAEPVEFVEQRWSAEPFSGGAPVACFGPGLLTGCGPALRRPVGPVHWAGTETADEWSGYIEGAVSSGERAAGEVLAALGHGADGVDGTDGVDDGRR